MAAAWILLALLLGIGVPIALYLLIERETADPTVTDRESAERDAQRRGGLDDRPSDGPVDRRSGGPDRP